VELIAWTLLVVGFAAVFVRFILREDAGEIVLPRVVEDSIGMWVIRRLTGSFPRERRSDDNAVVRPSDELPAVAAAALGASRPAIEGPVSGLAPLRLQALARPPAAVAPSSQAHRVEYSAARLRAIGVIRPILDDRPAVVARSADRGSP
jgi:hypothetical protein